MKTLIILLLAAGTWKYAPAQNTPFPTNSMPVKEQGDTSVTGFIMNALKISEKEIEAGRMAQEKAGNSAIKDYAARMVKDYSEAMALLKPLAAKKNVTLPSATEAIGVPQTGISQPTVTDQSASRIGTPVEKSPVPAATTNTATTGSPTTKAWADAKRKGDHSGMLESLSQKSGAEFDRDYMRMMVQDHMDAVNFFSRAATSGDTDIKNFATIILPVIKDHLQAAKTILGSLN